MPGLNIIFGYEHPKATTIIFGIILSGILSICLYNFVHISLIISIGVAIFFGILYEVLLYIFVLRAKK